MDKTDFLIDLQKKLKRYGVKNANDYLDYYSEYLDDLIESGLTDMQAIDRVGGVQKVLLEILSDEDVVIPETSKKAMGNLFLALGLPLWGPLVAALYITVLGLIFALLVCALAFGVAGVWVLISSLVVVFQMNILYAMFQLGVALMLLGLGVIFEQLFILSGKGLFDSSKYLFQKFNPKEAR